RRARKNCRHLEPRSCFRNDKLAGRGARLTSLCLSHKSLPERGSPSRSSVARKCSVRVRGQVCVYCICGGWESRGPSRSADAGLPFFFGLATCSKYVLLPHACFEAYSVLFDFYDPSSISR